MKLIARLACALHGHKFQYFKDIDYLFGICIRCGQKGKLGVTVRLEGEQNK